MIDTLLEHQGLYFTKFDDRSYTYRLLTMREYQVFQGLRDTLGLHEWYVYLQVFHHVVLEPELISKNWPLGQLVTIGQLVMYLSGDARKNTVAEDIKAAREIMETDVLMEHMRKTILQAFVSYVPQDIQKLSYPEFVNQFALAEQLLAQRVPGFKLLDLEAKPKAEPRKQGLVTTAEIEASRMAADAAEDNFAKLDRRLDRQGAARLDKLKKRR